MTQQTVNLGSSGNAGDGDNLRVGGDKINDNFTELYGRPFIHQVAISDETTELTTGAAKLTFRWPVDFELTEIRASLTDASDSGGTVQFDVNQSGISILSTKLTIDALEKTSTTAAVPAVISTSTMVDDAEVTVDIDSAGFGAAGAKLTFIGTYA